MTPALPLPLEDDDDLPNFFTVSHNDWDDDEDWLDAWDDDEWDDEDDLGWDDEDDPDDDPLALEEELFDWAPDAVLAQNPPDAGDTQHVWDDFCLDDIPF